MRGTTTIAAKQLGTIENSTKLATALAAGIALATIGCLAAMLAQHSWIVDAHGRPLVTDFLEVWVAGRTTLHGAAAAAYDPALHHAAQVAAAGHAFRGFLWWHYPPVVLFIAAGLGLMPYAIAFLAWVATTLAVYVAVIAKIARSHMAGLMALAMPAAFLNALAGQNGFLTAALIGCVLLNLEARPILAGVFLGLLTYKPQFGLVFPVVLAAAGHWRAFLSAALVAGLAILLPWAVFGGETIHAFVHFLPRAGEAMLARGDNGWNKLQTVYGFARWLGWGNLSASVLQGAVGLCAAAGLAWFWRRDFPYALKAAALATATLCATPYLYMYDYPVLVVALAFLHRQRSFDRLELAGIGLAGLSILVFVCGVAVVPIGPLAVLLTASLIARRAMGRRLGERNAFALQTA